MAYSLNPEDLERIRRSIVCLAPRQPAGLDREAAVALLGELQRLQGKDRRVQRLLVCGARQMRIKDVRVRVVGDRGFDRGDRNLDHHVHIGSRHRLCQKREFRVSAARFRLYARARRDQSDLYPDVF